MLHKITLDNVASYKQPAFLITDKKINLIYGLNGTGKSTFADFLYQRTDIDYSKCSTEPPINPAETEIIVYNRTFVQDNFYESETLKGIFSLSKENKEASEKIAVAEKHIIELDTQKNQKKAEQENENNDFIKKRSFAENRIWEIKQNYAGGDRVLEFCLDGLKGSKGALFDFLSGIPKPLEKPSLTISQVKDEVQALAGENAQLIEETIPKIYFSAHFREKDPILSKIIVGNKNSRVSELIDKLHNSDWVKLGFSYLPDELENIAKCPFCQQETITKQLLDELKKYFDEAYENDLAAVKTIGIEYRKAIEELPMILAFEKNGLLKDLKNDFDAAYDKFKGILERNIEKLRDKYKSPSLTIALHDSTDMQKSVNTIIEKANKLIEEFNIKITQKEKALHSLKKDFWNIQRWEYNQTITAYEEGKRQHDIKQKKLKDDIEDICRTILAQKDIILAEQQNVVNIDDAITRINAELLNLGIDDFMIIKYSENLYRISRGGSAGQIFKSLSEGEKMVISFLYFVELCRGKRIATDAAKKKIAVIDDPISSLSHIYVFNIGTLIQREFFAPEAQYVQVFILTHSLYFFYELLSSSPKETKKMIETFRVCKNTNGSTFHKMKVDEIQNDYQAYWYIIKDPNQSPALIANCMRNIIEYFFGFIEHLDLNNVFLKSCLADKKFQAFSRYINTESHSRAHHIFDIKEFDYDIFREAFSLVFKISGYEEHYHKMMGKDDCP